MATIIVPRSCPGGGKSYTTKEHVWAQKQFERACKAETCEGPRLVIIDNTNVTWANVEGYIKPMLKAGLLFMSQVYVLDLVMPIEAPAELAFLTTCDNLLTAIGKSKKAVTAWVKEALHESSHEAALAVVESAKKMFHCLQPLLDMLWEQQRGALPGLVAMAQQNGHDVPEAVVMRMLAQTRHAHINNTLKDKIPQWVESVA